MFHLVLLAKLPTITFFYSTLQICDVNAQLKYSRPKRWDDIALKIRNAHFLKFNELFKKYLIEKYKRD